MRETTMLQLRVQYREIASRLAAAGTPAAREQAERDIAALGLHVDGALSDLARLKEEVSGLLEGTKRLADTGTGPTTSAPQFAGVQRTVHVDRLGASTFIDKGWNLISRGDHAGAIEALNKALALSPGAVDAQSLLGWAQMLHEEYDNALATFSKVLMKEPANALARINVGYICLKKRIFGEAIEHLSKAIRLDNDRKATLYAHYYLGLVYLDREMYEDAETFFRKTLQLGPNLVQARFELGRALWLGGSRDRALHAWTEGCQANKFNPWAKRCQEMLELAAAGGDIPRTSLS